MLGLEKSLHQSGLEESLLHLVKLRPSQPNGCAYCIDMHWKDLRAIGEPEQRLYGLDGWEESPYFKALRVYVLGPTATLFSAFGALPIAYVTTSLAFAIIYVVLIDTARGNLVRAGIPLNPRVPGKGWEPFEAFYFSVSTMVKGSPQYEATGWCRWVAILEVLVSRLLELAIVTVDFTIILRHSAAVSSHP